MWCRKGWDRAVNGTHTHCYHTFYTVNTHAELQSPAATFFFFFSFLFSSSFLNDNNNKQNQAYYHYMNIAVLCIWRYSAARWNTHPARNKLSSSHVRSTPYNCWFPRILLSVRSRPFKMPPLFSLGQSHMTAVNDFMRTILSSFVFSSHDNSRNPDLNSGPCRVVIIMCCRLYYYQYGISFLISAKRIVVVSSKSPRQSPLANPHQPLCDLGLMVKSTVCFAYG